ncbi:hypothetical protein C8R46DRAFT_1041662 [Mycena filopes]|nr:hypothetical protein C8R46DRAFT_1041662 [Mycena filopes]
MSTNQPTGRAVVLYIPVWRPEPPPPVISTADDDSDDDLPDLIGDEDFFDRYIFRSSNHTIDDVYVWSDTAISVDGLGAVSVNGSFRLAPKKSDALQLGEPYAHRNYDFFGTAALSKFNSSYDSICTAVCKCACHEARYLSLLRSRPRG